MGQIYELEIVRNKIYIVENKIIDIKVGYNYGEWRQRR